MTAAAMTGERSARTPLWWHFLLRLYREKPLGLCCGLIVAAFVALALLAPLIAPYGVNDIDPVNRLKPPSWAFPFGTDNLGRDVFSRCLHGARTSVLVALTASALATVLSTLIGALTGYFGGKVDLVVQRLVDAWMTFPAIIVLIVVASVFNPGTGQVIVTLGLLFGIGGSRIIRGAVLSVRAQPFVQVARAIGASSTRILLRHVLPNILPPVIVLFTTRVGAVILAESGLAFLGLGVPPPAPTWGGMLSGSGRTFMFQGPWLALAPGLCLTLLVFAVNMFGDALRDILDPRMQGAA